jgi:hypothetical protein
MHTRRWEKAADKRSRLLFPAEHQGASIPDTRKTSSANAILAPTGAAPPSDAGAKLGSSDLYIAGQDLQNDFGFPSRKELRLHFSPCNSCIR